MPTIEIDRVRRQGPDGSLYVTADDAALPGAAALTGFNGAAAVPAMAATTVAGGIQELNAALAALPAGTTVARVNVAQFANGSSLLKFQVENAATGAPLAGVYDIKLSFGLAPSAGAPPVRYAPALEETDIKWGQTMAALTTTLTEIIGCGALPTEPMPAVVLRTAGTGAGDLKIEQGMGATLEDNYLVVFAEVVTQLNVASTPTAWFFLINEVP